MIDKQAVRLRGYYAPKLRLRKFSGRQPFREQSIQFFLRPRKAWHDALFYSGQPRIYDFLYRRVRTPAHDGLYPLFLLLCELDWHSNAPPLSAGFRVRKKRPACNAIAPMSFALGDRGWIPQFPPEQNKTGIPIFQDARCIFSP
jgi:hypothetical protein